MMRVGRIRKATEVSLTDEEVTYIYCALLSYTTKVPAAKPEVGKLFNEFTILMKELGF